MNCCCGCRFQLIDVTSDDWCLAPHVVQSLVVLRRAVFDFNCDFNCCCDFMVRSSHQYIKIVCMMFHLKVLILFTGLLSCFCCAFAAVAFHLFRAYAIRMPSVRNMFQLIIFSNATVAFCFARVRFKIAWCATSCEFNHILFRRFQVRWCGHGLQGKDGVVVAVDACQGGQECSQSGRMSKSKLWLCL